MGVLLDTNFYLSLIHPKDPNAQRGAEILQELSTEMDYFIHQI
ncbi:MAG: hypothetical protein ACFFCZ_22240 [Promethearchaeota archaeon]